MAGPLFVVGGHEEKSRDPVILDALVQLAGGPRATIAIVPTASTMPRRVAEDYERVFRKLGVRRVMSLPLLDRRDAEALPQTHDLDPVTAVYFSGGDQLRITSTLGGTAFHHWVRERHAAGMVVAGTSAGASMMSDTMIVSGDPEESPTRNTVRLAVGMGFWPGVVVDQHFSQRGRIARLLSALAQNPAILGVGIDENTAIAVDLPHARFAIVGERTVTVLDGRHIRQTNASESSPDAPLMLSHVSLHVLPRGWSYSWAEREPIETQTVEEGVR